MQRLSHILSCLVFLFPCLFLADGCANSRLLPPTTQAPTTQKPTTQGTTACSGTCTPRPPRERGGGRESRGMRQAA